MVEPTRPGEEVRRGRAPRSLAAQRLVASSHRARQRLRRSIGGARQGPRRQASRPGTSPSECLDDGGEHHALRGLRPRLQFASQVRRECTRLSTTKSRIVSRGFAEDPSRFRGNIRLSPEPAGLPLICGGGGNRSREGRTRPPSRPEAHPRFPSENGAPICPGESRRVRSVWSPWTPRGRERCALRLWG